MKKNLLSAILLVISISAFSQLSISYELKETADFYRMNQLLNKSGKTDLAIDDIKGSPYLNREFIGGTIFTTEKTRYENIPLRYNLYNDDLEFKNPAGEVLAVAKPEIVELAVLGETQLIYCRYTTGNKTKNGFLVVIGNGKAVLAARQSVLYQPPTEAAAYKEPEPAKFVRRADEFYIRVGEETAKQVANKKSLLEALPDNHDKIETFLDENKVKLNKAEGLAEVVKYYNSL